ncbi:Ctr copper transporter, partial [Eremomyces bilateralis CBS 781.70]
TMLWNWNVMDACFLSKSWHITSKGMFAGSCIGVILLVMVLELLRRLGKEYDRLILRQHQTAIGIAPACPNPNTAVTGAAAVGAVTACTGPTATFRPNVLQQAIRALLHMLQFAVAYFVMLLAMYYNGYIIICIFIGAFIGSFLFSWEAVSFG